ncbi:MAG TPA: hypothetical protein VNH38_01940 [Candidatus Dormibacteraeota bacterium]|nr:hypothetical protein [Candidatus Dormibacteraeota bacterium]
MAEDPVGGQPWRLAGASGRLRGRVSAILGRYPLIAGVAAASVVVGLAVGIGSFALQSHFTALYQEGKQLSGWQNYLRLGTPWQSLLPVLLAGLLATWGALRMSSAQPEPPVSLGATETATAGQLRAALRAERRTVRVAFVGMTGLVGVVVARFLVYSALALSGNRLAGSTWFGVTVELACWLAAWAAFWNWNRSHRNRIEGWGVLGR